jgi:hypothetical protein
MTCSMMLTRPSVRVTVTEGVTFDQSMGIVTIDGHDSCRHGGSSSLTLLSQLRRTLFCCSPLVSQVSLPSIAQLVISSKLVINTQQRESNALN